MSTDTIPHKTFLSGERILSKGDTASAAYMILKGEVRVFLEEGSRKIDLATLKENDIFGETAIFTKDTHGANCEALTDCTLMVITPEALSAMLEATDPILRNIVTMLIKRLRQTNEALLRSETREFMDIALI